MADDDQIVSSFFPDPPPFYRHFTSENRERLKSLTEGSEAGKNESGTSPQLSPSRLLGLPAELRFLIPPEPPTEDNEYRIFGEVTKGRGIDEFDNIMQWLGPELARMDYGALQGWEFKQEYPSPPTSAPSDDLNAQQDPTFDRQAFLLRLLRSVLLQFVELLSILAVDPISEDKDKKLRDIVDMVANIHGLVNEYRPHQARETLIHLMEDQLEKKRAEVEGIRRMREKVKETLAEFGTNAPDKAVAVPPEVDPDVSAEEKRKESQRQMWHAMNEVLGQ